MAEIEAVSPERRGIGLEANMALFATIWKYDVGVPGVPFAHLMPDAALPLDVQVQDGRIVMWLGVNPDLPRVTRRFVALGTGWQVPEECEYGYIGTVQQDGLVWHVFSMWTDEDTR